MSGGKSWQIRPSRAPRLPSRGLLRSVLPGYLARAAIDLSKAVVMVGLSLASVVLLPVSGTIVPLAATRPRSDLTLAGGAIHVAVGLGSSPAAVLFAGASLGVVLAAAPFVVPHELMHGACFRLFALERPRYGWKLIYAYARAPGWQLSRGQYLFVGLAPLAGISPVGMALLPIVLLWPVTLSGGFL